MNTSRTQIRSGPKRVRDAMQENVVGVVPEMTVRELIHVLLEDSISGVPVLDSQGKVIGVVSATDVLRLAADEPDDMRVQFGRQAADDPGNGMEPDDDESGELLAAIARDGTPDARTGFDDYQVRDIMTAIPFTLGPTDTLEDAARLLLGRRIHRVLVLEDGALRGVITPFDLIEAVEW